MLKNQNIIFTREPQRYESEGFITIEANSIKTHDRLYKKYNLVPEAQDSVKIEFILQESKFIRILIKELDILLKVTGLFEMVLIDNQAHSTYSRSKEQVKYEFAIATNGRYKLISSESKNGTVTLGYKKHNNVIIEGDSIDKWSFGIITDGRKNSWVLELISSIHAQDFPHYEIIICGPTPFGEKEAQVNEKIYIIDDVNYDDDIRAPISHKKNAIIREAKYNNLCIVHDRYLLPETWYKNFKKYGNYFDALCLKNLTPSGDRYGVDWMKFSYPLTSRFKLNAPLMYNDCIMRRLSPVESFW